MKAITLYGRIRRDDLCKLMSYMEVGDCWWVTNAQTARNAYYAAHRLDWHAYCPAHRTAFDLVTGPDDAPKALRIKRTAL